ncbi:response regulator [Rhodobacter sp. NSM]|uniref:response regulator n=1 Tax=Rhodobacter sp. NSM TaxID=3457501 RepID=UPI003FD6727C
MDHPEPREERIAVLVADDQPLVRELILGLLAREPDMTTEAAEDLPGVLARIEAHGPFDVVLLDFFMPGVEGMEGLGRAISANGGRPVLLMSGNLPDDVIAEARRTGVAGFLEKTQFASIAAAVREAATAGAPCKAPPETRASNIDLTEADLDLLRELVEGRPSEILAERMGAETFATGLRTLFDKLGVGSRTQAVLAAKRRGLV